MLCFQGLPNSSTEPWATKQNKKKVRRIALRDENWSTVTQFWIMLFLCSAEIFYWKIQFSIGKLWESPNCVISTSSRKMLLSPIFSLVRSHNTKYFDRSWGFKSPLECTEVDFLAGKKKKISGCIIWRLSLQLHNVCPEVWNSETYFDTWKVYLQNCWAGCAAGWHPSRLIDFGAMVIYSSADLSLGIALCTAIETRGCSMHVARATFIYQ